MVALFKKKPTAKMDQRHGREPIDPWYQNVDVEEIALYQYHFSKILCHVDVPNYTLWSMRRQCDRERLAADDQWTAQYLKEMKGEFGIDGAILQNMLYQYFFADVLARHDDKRNWVKRVMYRQPTDYFPDATRLRQVMGLVST